MYLCYIRAPYKHYSKDKKQIFKEIFKVLFDSKAYHRDLFLRNSGGIDLYDMPSPTILYIH